MHALSFMATGLLIPIEVRSMSLRFLLEERILEASLRSETFTVTRLRPFLLLAVFNIRRIHINFQFLKNFQNSVFQSAIITCFGNTGQFQTLTSGVLTVAPALML